MANERLRTAILASGANESELADLTGVDPKTVERWVGGRTPYRRHRFALARRLGADENYLWPQARSNEELADASESEILTIYPHRWAMPREALGQLFDDAEEQIGILVYSGLFLTATNYDRYYQINQITTEKLFASGAVSRDYFVYEPDTLSGTVQQVRATVESANVFPFYVTDSLGIFLFRLHYAPANDTATKIYLIRNRRFLGDGPDFELQGASQLGVLKSTVRLSELRDQTVVIAFFYQARTRG